MKLRSQSALPAIMMIVAIFAVLLSVTRTAQLSRWNSLYRDGFVQSGGEYDPVSAAKSAGSLAADFGNIPGGVFTLGSSLSYYDSPDGSAVLTLEPGEYVPAGLTEDTANFYGERSLPASDGWRYVRPFVKSGGEPGEGLYVKSSDLLCAIEDALPENDSREYAFGGGEGVVRELSAAEHMLLANDIALYDAGIYRSGDAEVNIFETRTVFTGIAGILLTGWSVFLFVYNSRAERGRAK